MIPGFDKIIEDRIKKAKEEGKFDDLPGKGKKIEFEDDSNIPEELRLSYKILKNAGFVPPEVELRKEIMQIESLMKENDDLTERKRLLKKLNFLRLKVNMKSFSPLRIEIENQYSEKIIDKLDSGKK